MSRAAIGLGGNVGDRPALLDAAAGRIASLGRIVRTSALYETAPWGNVRQPLFINAALVLETELPPEELLDRLLEIERALGRDRGGEERWGPRLIDLDLLLYDDRVVKSDALAVPHPRLHERAFALVPLAEIAPEAVHPVLGETVGAIAARVGTIGVRRLTQRLHALPRA